MSIYNDDSSVPGWMMGRLKRAIGFSNQGASSSWTASRRASSAVRSSGQGFSVSMENPMSVRRAVLALENHKPSGGK